MFHYRSVRDILFAPFPDSSNLRDQIKQGAVIGLFVAFFLFFFEPFGLTAEKHILFFVSLGFGMVTFLVTVIFEIINIYLLKIDKESPSWTFLKWFFNTLILIFFIAIGNYVFLYILQDQSSIRWNYLLTMIGNTYAIGSFPIAFSGFLHLERTYKKNTQHAINIKVHKQSTSVNSLITLPSSSDKSLSFHEEEILFLEAKENYVRIVFTRKGKLNEELLRNTLKDSQNHLTEAFIKCHRSFIVNRNKVEKVDGNAQGLVLTISHTEQRVPVSRSFISDFKSNYALYS